MSLSKITFSMKILIAGFLQVPRNIDKFRFIEERD